MFSGMIADFSYDFFSIKKIYCPDVAIFFYTVVEFP